MRFIYPVVIRKKTEGGFHAFFPDLALCEADGDDLMNTVRNANLAAYDWIDLEMQEDEPDLPPASDRQDLVLEDGDIVRDILVIYRMNEGWDE